MKNLAHEREFEKLFVHFFLKVIGIEILDDPNKIDQEDPKHKVS